MASDTCWNRQRGVRGGGKEDKVGVMFLRDTLGIQRTGSAGIARKQQRWIIMEGKCQTGIIITGQLMVVREG